MKKEEKQDVMMRCDWTKLESAELKELDELGVVSPHNMVSIYHNVLVKTEKERDEEREKNKKEQSAKAIMKKNPEEPPANETRLWTWHCSFGIRWCDFCREIGWITLKYQGFFGGTQKIDTHVRELDLIGENKNKQEKLGLIAHKHDAQHRLCN